MANSKQDSSGAHRLATSESNASASGQPPTSNRLRALGANQQAGLARAPSTIDNQEIFMLPRQKSGGSSKGRRESRMFLVDGQLCWADDPPGAHTPGAFTPGKRSSSIGLMFGSSMDLSGLIGQSIDSSGGGGSGGSASEEAISYRIKWCRDNIMQLKRQTWPMEKKLQVLKASKMFIKQHQGELKQSKQAKDVLASTSAIFERYWRHFKRELANFLVIITPWEMRIKKIESHFGSVVASYFTFLRWIFWLNLANSLVMVCFVMVPELIENVPDLTGMRKGELGMKRLDGSGGVPEFNPTLGEMWEFEGFLKFSPIFYGYYSNVEISRSGFWRNPLAFLLSAMLTYLFCFFCISRKLSQNTKLSRIGSKDDEYTFCWTVFVGWDFMIGNSETAYNKTSSLVMNLKEGILEEKEQSKDRDWRLIIRRVFANLLTIILIMASAYVVTLAVQRSENLPEDASLLQKNELQLVMSGIQFMFPPLFDVIGIIEKYHPRKALSWQLGRILFLDFLNFYTLMFSLFGTVDQMSNQLNEVSGNITLFRKNATYINNLFTTTTTTSTTTTTTTSTTTTTTTQSPILNTISTNETSFASNLSEATQLAEVASISTTSVFDTNSTSTTNSNATATLTRILLASTTMMPTSIEMNYSTLANGFSVPAVGQQQQTTLVTASTSPFSVSQPNFVTDSTTISATSTIFLTSFSDQMTTVAPSTPQTASEEDDYPDAQDVLASVQSEPQAGARRRKRSMMDISKNLLVVTNQNSEIERDDSVMIDPIVFRKHLEPQATQVSTHERIMGLPPIQDPYGRIGQQFRPAATANPSRIVLDDTGHQMNDNYEEDEQEEPLEGRLQVTRSRAQATTTRRPPTTAHSRAGVARPFGSTSVPRGQKPAGRFSTNQLNSDTNEDLMSDQLDDADDEEARRNILVGRESELGAPELMTASSAITQSSLPDSSAPATASGTSGATSPQEQSTGSLGANTGATMTPSNEETSSSNSIESSSTDNRPTSRAGFSLPPPLSGGAATTSIEENNSSTNKSDVGLVIDGASNNLTHYHMLNAELSEMSGGGVGGAGGGGNKSSAKEEDEKCVQIPKFRHQEILALNSTLKDKLKTLCWETMFGQEMVKIVVMDLVMTIVSAVSFEFMRACFVRYCNRFFFWDLERGLPGYQDFKLAENVLHLVNNQSTVWMGMFFAPGLPAINTVKLAILMYIRSWAVLTCNIPHETVFKVSKSNNFYYWILLINLLICILPVAYAVTWIRPSWHCGPFGGECRMYLVVTKLLKQMLPPEANTVFRYITSPGAVVPILIALILIIYYLASTVSSSKEANKELKAQLKKDKEQEAAVPEITNTTVVDQVSSTAAPPSAAQPATANAIATNPPLGSTLGLDLAAASEPISGQRPPDLTPITNTRPKSLLMPPPM